MQGDERPPTVHVDLSGTWLCDGYQCPSGVLNRELVEIQHDGESVIATKIVGDDCVPAGFESFSGRLPQSSPTGAIVWTVGTPRAPASAQRPGHLKVLSPDKFRAGDEFGDLVFHRQA